jgi:hypothetical protein
MSTNFKTMVTDYLRARTAAQGTRDVYSATVKKWEQWGKGVALEQFGLGHRKQVASASYRAHVELYGPACPDPRCGHINL